MGETQEARQVDSYNGRRPPAAFREAQNERNLSSAGLSREFAAVKYFRYLQADAIPVRAGLPAMACLASHDGAIPLDLDKRTRVDRNIGVDPQARFRSLDDLRGNFIGTSRTREGHYGRLIHAETNFSSTILHLY